ncbi:MAG: replication initiation protein [Pseudorhodobacter sp. PARRP1]|nr:MAG: replication initiation protein [Pseudorhodobacter sp. PARRP1]
MKHISVTPFGRQAMTAGLLAARALSDEAALPQSGLAQSGLARIDKWSLFNDLRTARLRFGLSDRDLSVLYALLTFLPAKALEDAGDLVVFPSNAALSDRAHGMAESTLRRHLAVLVNAGLIWRQDSPNGKRYAARDRSGALVQAFGLDLRPLLLRAGDIVAAAAEVAQAADHLHRAREALVLRMRDAAKLLAYGIEAGLPGDWAGLEARLLPLRAALRRKMDADVVAGLLGEAGDILQALRVMIDVKAEKRNGTDAHSERHHTNSKQDSYEFEPCLETGRGDGTAAIVPDPGDGPQMPSVPLVLVLKACPDIQPYARSNLTQWRDLVVLAAELRGMMGISASAWAEAQRCMGPETAAIAVVAMMQRIGSISNPGGYLRALSGKAAAGGFSAGPMIMALLNSEGARAA